VSYTTEKAITPEMIRLANREDDWKAQTSDSSQPKAVWSQNLAFLVTIEDDPCRKPFIAIML
jgi:hypothetical protein